MNQELENRYSTQVKGVNSVSRPQKRGLTWNEFQQAKEDIHWDVAWQIFDEVNMKNDTNKVIDLHCLQVDDATAICK